MKDRYGKPGLEIEDRGRSRPLAMSLTHKEGLAGFCAIWEEGFQVGMDLEAISIKPWRLRYAFGTSKDYLMLAPASLEYFTVLWSCKEAVAKALGLGLLIDFKGLIVSAATQGRFTAGGVGVGLVEGCYHVVGDMVAAVAWKRNADTGGRAPGPGCSELEWGQMEVGGWDGP